MNKTFTRLFAGALAAASLFALAACGEKKDEDQSANASTPAPITEAPSVTDEPTAEPTAVPTEVPTEAPTPTPIPEPTATPVPWITDPNGIIPNDVEIAVLGDHEGTCIAARDGKAFLQKWTSKGLEKEWEIPEQIMEAETFWIREVDQFEGGVYMMADITSDSSGPFWNFYQDSQGRSFSFKCNDVYFDNKKILISTADGKAIWYQWGEDYYKMHDFGPDASVEIISMFFYVNGEGFLNEWIEWENIPLS